MLTVNSHPHYYICVCLYHNHRKVEPYKGDIQSFKMDMRGQMDLHGEQKGSLRGDASEKITEGAEKEKAARQQRRPLRKKPPRRRIAAFRLLHPLPRARRNRLLRWSRSRKPRRILLTHQLPLQYLLQEVDMCRPTSVTRRLRPVPTLVASMSHLICASEAK